MLTREGTQKRLAPQPGPQTAFLTCGATIVIFGGSVGSGKTYSLLLDWLRYANTPGANGLIVRNRATDITIGGGLWDEAKKVFAGTGAKFRGGNVMDITWPSGAKLSFRHLDERNHERFKGPGFSWVGIEEANECPIESILYLLSRLRTTCGSTPVLRMSTNPDPDHEIAKWIDWYLLESGVADREKSGVLRYMLRSNETGEFVFGDTPEEAARLSGGDAEDAISFSFIPSLLSDNPALDDADPAYRKKLALLDPIKRAQLVDGNWKIRPELGGMLRWTRWGHCDKPLAPIVKRIRGWDKAATRPREANPNPDFTAGVLLMWDIHGRFYVADLSVCREETPEVDALMSATASSDGTATVQAIRKDPAQAGKVDVAHTKPVLRSRGRCGPIVVLPEFGDKITKAQPLANALAEGMTGTVEECAERGEEFQPRGYILCNGWTDRPYADAGSSPKTLGDLFWSQVEPFFDQKAKDDIVDAMATAYAAKDQIVEVVQQDPVARMAAW